MRIKMSIYFIKTTKSIPSDFISQETIVGDDRNPSLINSKIKDMIDEKIL